MARMMGRFRTPGCCPGTKAGLKPGPDCGGGFSVTPHYRRKTEKCAWKREAEDAKLAEPMEN